MSSCSSCSHLLSIHHRLNFSPMSRREYGGREEWDNEERRETGTRSDRRTGRSSVLGTTGSRRVCTPGPADFSCPSVSSVYQPHTFLSFNFYRSQRLVLSFPPGIGISRYTLISLPDIAFCLGHNGRLSVDSVPPTSAVSVYHLLVSLPLLLLRFLQIGTVLALPWVYSVAPLSLCLSALDTCVPYSYGD